MGLGRLIRRKMEVRKATIDDLGGILELSQLHFEKEKKEYDKYLSLNWTYSEKGRKFFTDSIVDDDRFGWIAIDDGHTAGYLFGKAYDEPIYELKMADLGPIFIKEEFRHQGIGSKLMAEFLKWAKENQVKRIAVVTDHLNKEAINFYKKHGFSDFHIKLKQDL